MKHIIINGKFTAERMQGIVRYAKELLAALDKQLTAQDKVLLVVPECAENIPDYAHIKVIRFGKRHGILWEQTDLRRFVRKHPGGILLNLCNTSPLFAGKSITTVHDIMYRVNPSHYTSLRNRVSRLWHMLQYSYLFRHEKMILTVSRFSKREMERVYPCSRGKIRVIPNAWQHTGQYTESTDWQARYPQLKSGEFLFSLATLSKNKNGRWIMETAKRNPQLTFAMAGQIYETEYDKLPDNVHLLGFVSDGDACALMKHCKAFLFPSLYEGFGLPPLEALALGAEVISSNAASLPEVLGDSVHYIDPYNYDVDLEALLREPTADAGAALRRFSWNGSARKLLQYLREF